MKLRAVLNAITALKDAERFLKSDCPPGGILLSGECFHAWFDLMGELLTEFPEIKIERETENA